MAVLQARNLSLAVEDVELLADIDLVLEAGQVTAVLGPNGAGKTSLLRLLTGEWTPGGGSVELNGRALAGWSDMDRARMMGVLPQGSALEFPFTAEEVVLLGRTPHDTGLFRDREIARAALHQVGGEYLWDRPYTRLSGGEKQRVQLARVLAQVWEPLPDRQRLLVLDEPTAWFDLAHQQLLLETVRHFAGQGVAVLLVLHDLSLAAGCADQLLLLRCGRPAALGSPGDVIRPDIVGAVFDVNVRVIPHPETGLPVVIT